MELLFLHVSGIKIIIARNKNALADFLSTFQGCQRCARGVGDHCLRRQQGPQIQLPWQGSARIYQRDNSLQVLEATIPYMYELNSDTAENSGGAEREMRLLIHQSIVGGVSSLAHKRNSSIDFFIFPPHTIGKSGDSFNVF